MNQSVNKINKLLFPNYKYGSHTHRPLHEQNTKNRKSQKAFPVAYNHFSFPFFWLYIDLYKRIYFYKQTELVNLFSPF